MMRKIAWLCIAALFAVLFAGPPALPQGVAPKLALTPEYFGASVAASDNSSAMIAALQSGYEIRLQGLYKIAGALTVTGCPSISGGSPSTQGFLFTGSGAANGLTINCSPIVNSANSGKVNLSAFGVYTNQAGATGAPLKLNFAAQAPANVVIQTLDMRNVHVSGQSIGSNYWTTPVTCVNCYGANVYYNWISGSAANYEYMTAGLYFVNSAASVPSMVNNVIGNSIYDTSKGIYAVSAGGQPALEGFVIRDNALVTNDYAVYADESANSYYAPGWILEGNATNSAVASYFLKHVAQVFIDDCECYTSSTTGDGIVLNDVNTLSIGAKEYIGAVNGASTGAAIRSIGSGNGFVMGGILQNFATGVSLDSASSTWIVYPTINYSITTAVSNAGSGNLLLSYNKTSNLYAFNAAVSAYSIAATSWYSSTANNLSALPAAGSGNSFSIGWNYSGGAEMDFFNTNTSGGGTSFAWYQMTSPTARSLLGYFTPAGTFDATAFAVGGVAGFTGTKTAGSCTLSIAGGLVTNVTGC